jgi:hypothetical protein
MMDITRGPGETLWVNGEQVWPKERAKSEQPAAQDAVEEMLDAWYGDTEGLPPYDDLQRGGMTAAYEVARKHCEQERDVEFAKLKENADFLRRSVGAVHMMISRDDLTELDGNWCVTDLPPRLKMYINDLQQGRCSMEQIEAAIREELQEGHGWVQRPIDDFIEKVRKRLSQPASKPALQEQIKIVLQEAHRVSDDFDTTAGEILALVRADGRGKNE